MSCGTESPRRIPAWPRRWRHWYPSKWWKPQYHIQGDFRLYHHCCENLRSSLVNLVHSHCHTVEYKQGGVIRVFPVGSTVGDRRQTEADRNVMFLFRVSIETCPRARQVCCSESLPSLQDIQWLCWVQGHNKRDAVCLRDLFYYTGLLKIIVGVLTTCHTQYTWDRSI